MTHLPLPAVVDEAGERIPEGLPPVVDAHVHVFPDLLFDAVWDWFGTDFPNIPYAWDRELRRLAAMGLEGDLLGRLLAGNAAALFKIDLGADDAGNPTARKDSLG